MDKVIKKISLPSLEWVEKLIKDRNSFTGLITTIKKDQLPSAHPDPSLTLRTKGPVPGSTKLEERRRLEECMRTRELQTFALKKYADLNHEIYDQEFNKLISCQINWEELMDDVGPHTSFDRLRMSGCGNFLSLEQALEFKPELGEIITKFIDSQSTGLPISLLALSICKIWVLYIRSSTTVSHIINQVIDAHEQLVLDVLVLVVPIGIEAIYSEVIQNLESSVLVKSLIIYVEPQAKLTVVIDNRTQGTLLSHVSAYLATGAQLTITAAQTHTGTTLNFCDFELLGEQTQVDYRDYCSLTQQAQYALCVTQNHVSPSAQSAVSAKVLLQDSARGFYRGNISIEKEAVHSQAQQKQVSLMLSEKARNCAIPSLEVKNNLVQCTHGTATGKLSEDQLWYLYSRGLTETQAKKLIIDGFFCNLQELPYTQELRTRLQEHTHGSKNM